MRRALVACAVVLGLWCAAAVAEEPPSATAAHATGDAGTAGPSEAKREAGGEPETLPRVTEQVTVVAKPLVEGTAVTPFAAAVTVVGADQVEALNAWDVASALRRVPGVVISRYNVVGSYGGAEGGAVFIRGQGSSRPGAELSFLVDGVPRFVGVWTHPLLDLLSPQTAASLEVHRAPEPVLFGNMAFAAVSLKPKLSTTTKERNRLQLLRGRWDTFLGILEHEGDAWGFRYRITVERQQSDGHRSAAAGEVDRLVLHLGRSLSPRWQWRLVADATDAWAEDPGPVGGPPRGVVPRFGVRDSFAVTTFAHQHGNFSGEVKLYSQNGDIRWRQWDPTRRHGFVTATDFLSWGVRWQERWEASPKAQVVFGVDRDSYGGAVEERRPTGVFAFSRLLFTNTAPYALASLRLGSRWQVEPSVGVRYNRSDRFGGVWGGQAGVVVRRGGHALYLRASRGFNLPGVYAAVFSQRWNRPGQWRGLDPELVHHGEVGYQWQGAGGSLWLAAFHEKVRDALRVVAFPPPPRFANLGTYRVRGVEALVQWDLHPALAATAGVTYLDPTPDEVPNAPRWTSSLGLTWSAPAGVRVSVDGQRVGARFVLNPRFDPPPREVPGYTSVNARVAWPVYHGNGFAAEFLAAGENLLGEEVYYQPGYPAPKRLVTAGVSLRF